MQAAAVAMRNDCLQAQSAAGVSNPSCAVMLFFDNTDARTADKLVGEERDSKTAARAIQRTLDVTLLEREVSRMQGRQTAALPVNAGLRRSRRARKQERRNRRRKRISSYNLYEAKARLRQSAG